MAAQYWDADASKWQDNHLARLNRRVNQSETKGEIMSLKKPWKYKEWEIIPSYIILETERQTYWCEHDNGSFKNLRPNQNAKRRSDIEALL